MKTTRIAVFTLGCLCAAAAAGEPMMTMGKSYKNPLPPEQCFGDHELQLDIFGQYGVGNGPTHSAIFNNHAWGGGIGINYFFTRNVGIGVDAAALYGSEAPYLGGDHDTTYNFTGSLIFRWPIEEKCIAPYLYVGGGASVDGEQWASAHGGVGIEFRLKPQKLGLFLDGRWTYYGDRFGHEDLNNFGARAGVRFIF